MWSMPGMWRFEGESFEGEPLAAGDVDAVAPWSIPGIEEGSPEEPQAARTRARATAVPGATRARRRTAGRAVNMESVFPRGRTTPGGRAGVSRTRRRLRESGGRLGPL